MRWLPLILIGLLIYIESVLFVRIASDIGVLMTLALVVLTSCLGFSLVKNQGMKNVQRIQQKIMAGESPAVEMIKSVSLVLAGILLIIPGFFTDFLGLLLLLPPMQKLLVMRLMPYLKFYRPGQAGFGRSFSQSSTSDTNTFEGEFKRKQDDPSHFIEDVEKKTNNDNDDKTKH